MSENSPARLLVCCSIIVLSLYQLIICIINGITEDDYIISIFAFSIAGVVLAGITIWVGVLLDPRLLPFLLFVVCLGQGILAILVLTIPEDTITDGWQKLSLSIIGIVAMFISGLWLGHTICTGGGPASATSE
jgi:hypothetical protein